MSKFDFSAASVGEQARYVWAKDPDFFSATLEDCGLEFDNVFRGVAAPSPFGDFERRVSDLVGELVAGRNVVRFVDTSAYHVTDDGHHELEVLAYDCERVFCDNVDAELERDNYLDDADHELADGFVDVYTVGARKQFVDLNLWELDAGEVVELLGKDADIDNLVSVAIYKAARSVVAGLFDEFEELRETVAGQWAELADTLDDWFTGNL